MNPASNISSSTNQDGSFTNFATTLNEIESLITKKDYQAIFKKLVDLASFKNNPELSINQNRLKTLEILVITKIIFDKITKSPAEEFRFIESNLVEKFNQGIRFFRSQGISQKDLEYFSQIMMSLLQFSSDVFNNNIGKKRTRKIIQEKTIDKKTLENLAIFYTIFLLQIPQYLEPYLKEDFKILSAQLPKKKRQNLPLLLPASDHSIPKLKTILIGGLKKYFDYQALAKLLLNSHLNQQPLSLRLPFKVLKYHDLDFFKSQQFFDFITKIACDCDSKMQFKFYKSLITYPELSKAFLKALYVSFNDNKDSLSLIEIAIKNKNIKFLKTALKLKFKPQLFTKKIGNQYLSAKALAIRNGDIEVFKILFDEQSTKIPSQTEISTKNGKKKITFFNDLELAFAYERFDILKYLSQCSNIVEHKISSQTSDQILTQNSSPKPRVTKPFQFYDHNQKKFLSFDDYFNNFLIYAVIEDNLFILKALLTDCEDSIKDEHKINALYYAIIFNRAEMLAILVQKKLIEYKTQRREQETKIDGFELILNLDDELPCGFTPLQLSILYSSYEVMNVLIDLDCKISKLASNKESALSLAEEINDADALEIMKYGKIREDAFSKKSETSKTRFQKKQSLRTALDNMRALTPKSKNKSLMFSQQYKYSNRINYFYLRNQFIILNHDLLAKSVLKSYQNYQKTFKVNKVFLYNQILRENLFTLIESIHLNSMSFDKKIEHHELAKNYLKRSSKFNFYSLLTIASDFKPITQKKFIDNDFAVFLFVDLVLTKITSFRSKNLEQIILQTNPFPINHDKYQKTKDSLSDYYQAKLDNWMETFQHYLAINQELSSGGVICKKIQKKYYQDHDKIAIIALMDFLKIASALERFEINLPEKISSDGIDYFNKNPLELKKINEIVDQLFKNFISPQRQIKAESVKSLSRKTSKAR